MNDLFHDQPQFSQFEQDTAQLLAYQSDRSTPNAADMQQAVESIRKWNSQRSAAGLPLWG